MRPVLATLVSTSRLASRLNGKRPKLGDLRAKKGGKRLKTPLATLFYCHRLNQTLKKWHRSIISSWPKAYWPAIRSIPASVVWHLLDEIDKVKGRIQTRTSTHPSSQRVIFGSNHVTHSHLTSRPATIKDIDTNQQSSRLSVTRPVLRKRPVNRMLPFHLTIGPTYVAFPFFLPS